MPDAGWYRDPQDPSVEEYWDGQSWSGQQRPSTAAPDRSIPAPDPSAYAQPQFSPPTQQVWGQRPAYHPDREHRQDYAGATTPGAGRRRLPLVVAGVVVVALVAAGVLIFVLRSGGDDPTITYAGKPIAAPNAVLSTAQKSVDALVTTQHGTKSDDTRCYYARPTKPAKGAKASDVIDSLRCGPVLFLDGNAAKEYLTIPLTADTSGKQAALTPDTSDPGAGSLAAVSPSLTLVRPDGVSAPSGDGGLSVPQPPAAQQNSIVAATVPIGETPGLTLDSSMISKDQDVMVLGAGYVSRYGTGLAARSAPDGQRLLAFQISTGAGAIGSGGAAPTLVVDGSSESIPAAFGEQWDVASVPSGSTPSIQLIDNGFTQTLSLPSGTPGSGNIAVLTRTNTIGLISKDFTMKSTFSRGDVTEQHTLSVTADSADLYFWSPAHPQDHPSNPGFAYLSVDVTYTDSTQGKKVFGFDHGLLQLRLPDGGVVTPHNLAPKGKVYDVFTVPADFTSGTLTIGGAAKVGNGIHQSIPKSKHLAVRIPAN